MNVELRRKLERPSVEALIVTVPVADLATVDVTYTDARGAVVRVTTRDGSGIYFARMSRAEAGDLARVCPHYSVAEKRVVEVGESGPEFYEHGAAEEPVNRG